MISRLEIKQSNSYFYAFGDLLTIAFQIADGLVNLPHTQFSQVHCLFYSVIEGGDERRRDIFALSYCDFGLTLSDGVVVVGQILARL